MAKRRVRRYAWEDACINEIISFLNIAELLLELVGEKYLGYHTWKISY